ncbi:nucleotidyl transferase AbiEii/AbiGii toxin family protein [Nocardia sp. NPDC057663]|uniref:nucleotidyl transferase AbiEii/AbiGii toxin family protein n=1 Tax=Nocardia sp. NPDC057663 TaxID=3346201 RepID=UPI00366E6DE2
MSTDVDFHGTFEVHLTVRAADAETLAAAEAFAVRREMKFTHIVLARGRIADQPMLTLRRTGDLAPVAEAAAAAARELAAAGLPVIRTKIEVHPWGRGVPVTDKEGRARGPHRYFEHHLKLLLPPDTAVAAVVAACAGHNAHVSANARRTRSDGRVERFVTQRCREVGRHTSGTRLQLLELALLEHGYEVLSREHEYVVYDSDESVDDGWLDGDLPPAQPIPWEHFRLGPWLGEQQWVPGHAPPAAEGFPPTLAPVVGDGVRQRPVFDPSVQDRQYGMRLSEPYFADPAVAESWRAARRAALDHVLAAVAGTAWAEQLMVRGSVLLRAWYGADAREPGDLDFVVLTPDWTLHDARTATMLDDLAVAAQQTSAQSGGIVRIEADGAVADEIWTYCRVPGRRLVLPWHTTEAAIPGGTVQLDFVFGEDLPEPPVRTEVARIGTEGPGALLYTASPRLSLAWKLLWLASDTYPEGKDLFDAVLLAERAELPFGLFRAVIAPRAHERRPVVDFLDVAHWAAKADWTEFAKDHPGVADEHDTFVWRLLTALTRTSRGDLAAAYDRYAADLTNWADGLRGVYTDRGLTGLAAEMDRDPRPTLFRLVVLREVIGRDRCSLTDAADLLAQLPIPEECELPTRVDPHVIAAALSAAYA